MSSVAKILSDTSGQVDAILNPLDFSCYYDESSDEYHIPKGEHDELVESHTHLQKCYDITHSDDGWMNPTATRCYEELKEDVQQYKDTLEDHFHHYELLKVKNDNLEAEVKKLKKRIEEDHKAVPTFLIQDMYHDAKEENKKLKTKNENNEQEIARLRLVVAGLITRHEEEVKKLEEKNAELIAEKLKLDDEANKLTEDVEQERKISFWRMCESYNGFHKNTNIHDPDWIAEMNAMIEDKFEPGSDYGVGYPVSVEELKAGYLEWIDYTPEEESEDEGYQHSEEGDGFPRD